MTMHLSQDTIKKICRTAVRFSDRNCSADCFSDILPDTGDYSSGYFSRFIYFLSRPRHRLSQFAAVRIALPQLT